MSKMSPLNKMNGEETLSQYIFYSPITTATNLLAMPFPNPALSSIKADIRDLHRFGIHFVH